jgi:phospholipid transport system transporter-binding protein
MITVSDNKASLVGSVTLQNINALLAQGRAAFSAPFLSVDLAQVTEVDSTAVSLLLEWRRDAQRQNRVITFVNYPENLQSLMKLYGVSELLV